MKKAKPFFDSVLISTRPVETFAEAKNELQSRSKADYVLWWDTDEDFPFDFLKNLKTIIETRPALCYRFPRRNLPTLQNYPDYQVRLYRREQCHWNRGIHEIVMHDSGKPADQIQCVTLDEYPIVHLALNLHEFLDRFRWHAHLYVKAGFPMEHLVREVDEMVNEAKRRYPDQKCLGA